MKQNIKKQIVKIEDKFNTHLAKVIARTEARHALRTMRNRENNTNGFWVGYW